MYLNLFSAAMSIVLAVVALWLAIYFYKSSQAEAQKSLKAAADISASVTKLEKLFDSLYSDTFSIMRDTVTDMRQHVWRVDDKGTTSDTSGQLEVVRSEFMHTLEDVTERLGVAEDRMAELRKQVEPAVARALDESREMYPKEALRDRLLNYLLASPRPVPASSLIRFASRHGVKGSDAALALSELRKEGRITWEGPEEYIVGNSKVSLVRRRPVEADSGPNATK
jgi:hypothetical protein